MAFSGQVKNQAQSRIRLKLPQFLLIALIVLGACALPTMSVALLSKSSGLQNSFSPYLELLGQGRSAVVERGFDCRMADYAFLPAEYCILMEVGSFSSVGILVKDGVAQRIDFTVRDGGARIGDLALLCEIAKEQWANTPALCAPDTYMTVRLAENRRFSYLLPVRMVSFATTPR